MKRICGYIEMFNMLGIEVPEEKLNIQELLKYVLENNRSVTVRKVREKPQQFVFSFDYNNETFYFKFDKMSNPYAELIVEEIAKDLNMPYVESDIAVLGQYIGIISKNYKNKNAKYISGREVLKSYYDENFPKKYYTQNTLEGIWIALEEYYKDRSDMQEIVSNLMRKIVDIFILDLLTGQDDRHCDNWEIVEYADGRVDLQATFDNNRSLYFSPYLLNVLLRVDDDRQPFKDYDSADYKYWDYNLEKFYRYSSSEFSSLIVDRLWVIAPDNVRKVFKRIEMKTLYPMPSELKEEILSRLQVYQEAIIDTLDLTIDEVNSNRK